MEAVKHNLESPSLPSFSTVAALGLRQLRTFLAGDLLAVLARNLGALRLARPGLAPRHAQVQAAPAGDGVAGGLGHHQAALLLRLDTDLSGDLPGDWRTMLAGQADLGLGGDAVLGGDGAAD